jgi:methyltransferase family protein/SEC-C motif-containing protein
MAHGNGPRRRARLGWRGLQTDMESRHRPADLWDWVGPLYQLPPCLPDSAWSGHIPFLALLIRMAKPRTFVELGVWLGASFLAACEAAKIFDTGTRCFGVDTWRGDAHAGFFDGDPVFLPLSAFVAAHYPNAELIRASFEDALPRLADGSIDLLHIDGFHTYEAVSRDFRTWLPKLSPRGIVLFHDTEVRQADFGVWKLWGELKGRYRHIDFQHSAGLGMLIAGSEIAPELERLLAYCEEGPEQARWLRGLCERAAATLPDRLSARTEVPSLADQLVLRQPELAAAPSPPLQPAQPIQVSTPPSASPASAPAATLRRNDPCHCGSGKRFKHCHGRIE